MDKKSLTRLALVLSVISMVSFFSSMFPLIITAFGALAISIFAIKEKETTAKVLDPIVTVSCISLSSTVFTIINSIISKIISVSKNVNYNVVNNVNTAFNIISLIFTFLMIAAIIVTIIFVVRGKRVPLISKISDKLVDISTKKKEKKQEEKKNSEINETPETTENVKETDNKEE